MATSDFLFYFLSIISVVFAIAMITMENPVYCALALALTMISVAGLFVTLDAWFVAAVQVIVYAGAVMVLFVMVIMLFDLKHDLRAFSKGLISGALKLMSAGMVLGLIAGSIYMSTDMVLTPQQKPNVAMADVTEVLATSLFTKYMFGFQAIGALLLFVAVGAVALSRISGGTHADD